MRAMETTLTVVAALLLGLLSGSVLTRVVDRVPDGRSLQGPSRCRTCRRTLPPSDVVPIVGWLVRRGRCRRCGAAIGAEPLVIELATPLLFVPFALRFGAEPVVLAYFTLAAALVALVWIDLREFRLPREISYTAFAISAAAIVADGFLNDWLPVRDAFLGALLAVLIMGVIFVASRGQLGDGDVRLAPLLGLHLGYLGVAIVPFGLFLGFVGGALYALVAMVFGRADRHTAVPFGPFLAVGTMVAIFAGPGLIDRLWA